MKRILSALLVALMLIPCASVTADPAAPIFSEDPTFTEPEHETDDSAGDPEKPVLTDSLNAPEENTPVDPVLQDTGKEETDPLFQTVPQPVDSDPNTEDPADPPVEQKFPANDETDGRTDTSASDEDSRDVSNDLTVSFSFDKDSYVQGEQAKLTVRYTLGQGIALPGDYILLSFPESVLIPVSFSPDPTHFQKVQKQGPGQYRLILSDQADAGFSGSMSAVFMIGSTDSASAAVTCGTAGVTLSIPAQDTAKDDPVTDPMEPLSDGAPDSDDPTDEGVLPQQNEEQAERTDESLLLTGDNDKAGGNDASEHFHTVITSSSDTYTSGETAVFSIRYTLDQGAVFPGDYVIVTIPENIVSSATFSYSSQHFSGMESLGNGQYKLIFGENAETGLSGSMTVRAQTHADETSTGAVQAGDGEKEITVFPSGGGESGTGTYADEAIMKDGLGNEGMSYGGYDYSTDPPTQIGLFDSSVDQTFVYRLYINRKNVSMTGVTVRDTLPDGMSFCGTGDVSCSIIDPASMSSTGERVPGAHVSISGRTLTVRLGDIDYPVEIQYKVFVPAQTSVYLRNRAEVTYTQDGTTHQERHDYIAKGNDFSAVNGVKRVDKALISDDPSDQWVTYTIEFWNDSSFAPGDISLIDDLDDQARFLYAEDNEYFELTVDENDPTILRITNVREIPAGTRVYEVFVCDFSGVSVGSAVKNTVGGNTTVTKKISASLSLSALKTVDGSPVESGDIFSFRLEDQNRRLIATAQNDSEGMVTFPTIHYGAEDLGKTFTYYISEAVPSGAADYLYDTAVYAVTASVGESAGPDGIVPVAVTVEKDGTQAERIVFDNERLAEEKTRVFGRKIWDDASNQDGVRPKHIVIRLNKDGAFYASKTVTADDGWEWAFEDLDKFDGGRLIAYSVTEDPVPGYESHPEGSDIVNTHTPETVTIPVKKRWIGPESGSAVVELLADGVKAEETVLNAGNGWHHTFSGLPKYRNGAEITYTVREIPVQGYSTEIFKSADGFEIVNTSILTVSIPVEKRWIGQPLDSVTVSLLADGAVTQTAVIDAKKNWKHTFSDLPRYDRSDGHEILYTVTEKPIRHYTSSVTGDPVSGFLITNTKKTSPLPHVPKTGDDGAILLYVKTMLLSVTGLVCAVLYRKYRSMRKKG